MNAKVKEVWIKALRSGEFEQIEAYLRDANGFCCLGVLCELAVHEGIIPPPSQNNSGHYEYDGDILSLSHRVLGWAGMTEVNGNFVFIHSRYETLAGHNDAGATFEEIADAIEEQL